MGGKTMNAGENSLLSIAFSELSNVPEGDQLPQRLIKREVGEGHG